MTENSESLLDAAALGVVAGMRSQVPLALLALAAQRQDDRDHSLPRILDSPAVVTLLLASAAGEIVVDKLPFTPSRLKPSSLVFRAAIGGVAGALLTRRADQELALGGAVGAAGALVGSYVGFHVRRSLAITTGLPDPVFAVLEDVAAAWIAAYAVGLAGSPGETIASR